MPGSARVLRISPGAALQASSLKWFQSSAAGLEHPMLKAFGEKAEIYTSGHAQSEAIAEWVLWAAFDFFGQSRSRAPRGAGPG